MKPLNFDGLNPILAKIISECETQLGEMNKYCFELKNEIKRINIRLEEVEYELNLVAGDNKNE